MGDKKKWRDKTGVKKKLGRRDARKKNGKMRPGQKKWGVKMQDKKIGRQDARQKKNGET